MDTTTKVIEILAAQALRDPATIGPEDTLATLGLDSLGLVEVIFALEEAFDIAIPFNANAAAGAQVVANLLLEPAVQARAQDASVLGFQTVLNMAALSPADRARHFCQRHGGAPGGLIAAEGQNLAH